MTIILLVALLSMSSYNANPLPKYDLNFELVSPSVSILDHTLPRNQREKALDTYLKHPLVLTAFKRYSSNSRPPSNRVNADDFRNFIYQLWDGGEDTIQHERLKYIVPHYSWGQKNLELVKSDIQTIKSNIDVWIKKALKKIPFHTEAATTGTKTTKLVFLADPGGSYPWVWEDKKHKYIYFDILQLRGFSESSKEAPIDELGFKGFLIHEFFHLYQNDKFEVRDRADKLIAGTVAEGSAMLIGNNAPNHRGEKLFEDEQTYLSGKALQEWETEIARTPVQILEFIKLYENWKASPPTDEVFFETLSREGWLATPENGFLFGDIYRVGVVMLLDIKMNLGAEKFYEVLGNSELFIPTWKKAVKSK